MAKNKHKDKKREHPETEPQIERETELMSDEAATVSAAHDGAGPPEHLSGHSTELPKGFSLDDPKLPKEIEDAAMRSAGYPYDKRMKREPYEEELLALQIELMKLQKHNLKVGNRILCLYEGRDGSGKGSCIKAFNEHMNPRNTRTVALPKPTETERGQLYFQRYAVHLPTSGEIVLFDRSWYNRVRDGIKLFKFYLTIGREMQLARFHERAQDPLKQWKLSPVDLASLNRYDDYTRAETEMFRFTHTAISPWIVVRANDQRRARLETIRHVLLSIEYEGRDLDAIGKHDPLIIGYGPAFFHPHVDQRPL